jgi:hypothetical protein
MAIRRAEERNQHTQKKNISQTKDTCANRSNQSSVYKVYKHFYIARKVQNTTD